MTRKISDYSDRPLVVDGGMRCTHTNVITGKCTALLKKGVIKAMKKDHKGRFLSDCKCYKHNKAGARRRVRIRIGPGALTRSLGR